MDGSSSSNSSSYVVAAADVDGSASRNSEAAALEAERKRLLRSKKKNLRRKRRRQQKKQSGELPPRPRGHKRRRKTKAPTSKCAICLVGEVTHIFIPCGHLWFCEQCANRVYDNERRCPACRQHIQACYRTNTINTSKI